MNNPVWIDEKGKIIEPEYCRDFLSRHPMRCINDRFYTVDGPLTDESKLKRTIYEEISPWLHAKVAQTVEQIIKALKLAAYTDPLPLQCDRIHVANGSCFLDGTFTEEKEYCGNRLSVSDAFRSATGDIRERIPVTSMGESHIYLAYCLDNKRTSGVLSRELVKETLNQQTNRYEKLANISYDKEDGIFRCDNLVMDDAVDVPGCCRRAEELFELYQRCANRKQIETICTNYLRSIEATKLSITGHMYFVPRTYMDKVDIFEDFINLLGGLNRNDTPLMVNSFYIIDDEKQRDKMTEEFYAAVKKEIATYQERADYLIKSGSQSPAVMDRWVLKIQGREEKKRHYEQVLRRELDGLDDEFSTLKFLSQELQMRSRSIRFQKAA